MLSMQKAITQHGGKWCWIPFMKCKGVQIICLKSISGWLNFSFLRFRLTFGIFLVLF